MPATGLPSLQRYGWLSAALLLTLSSASRVLAQDYNYPPQQSYNRQGYGQSGYNQQNYGQPGDSSLGDPPSRVARVSMLQGNVSLQPAGVEDFSQASLNYPLTSGDRIYSDNGSIAELEAGQLALRLGSATDLSVTAMTDQIEQFGLGQGSVHVRSYDLDPNATLEIDTPNVAVTVLAPGDLRVDVSPDGNMTQVTLLSGQARVDGPGFEQQLQPGESLQLTGSEPVYAQDVRRPRSDGLDRFSNDRDRTYQNAVAMEADYVNPATIGAEDLGQYGDWNNDSDYGPVWYPRGVAADWQPYSYGRWAYVAPWGWTWVENEPWGFAPFHYGRWARFGSRWGWIPGPPVVRPVYSPALVAFVGGGGANVTAWFPLGPREPYVPWYRSSSLYANRINVSNIYSRNSVEVRNIYNQRSTNVYVNNGTFNRSYINRGVATVAVPQGAFAGGRPVHEVSMHLPPQQFANGPLLVHPNASPTRQIMASAPARALPPRLQRPPVESRSPAFAPGGFSRPDRDGNDRGGDRDFYRRGGANAYNGNAGNNDPGRGSFSQQPGNPSQSQWPRGGERDGNRLGGYPARGTPVLGNPSSIPNQQQGSGMQTQGDGPNRSRGLSPQQGNPSQGQAPNGAGQYGDRLGNYPVRGTPVMGNPPSVPNQPTQGEGTSGRSGGRDRGRNSSSQQPGTTPSSGPPPQGGPRSGNSLTNSPVSGTPVFSHDPSVPAQAPQGGQQRGAGTYSSPDDREFGSQQPSTSPGQSPSGWQGGRLGGYPVRGTPVQPSQPVQVPSAQGGDQYRLPANNGSERGGRAASPFSTANDGRNPPANSSPAPGNTSSPDSGRRNFGSPSGDFRPRFGPRAGDVPSDRQQQQPGRPQVLEQQNPRIQQQQQTPPPQAPRFQPQQAPQPAPQQPQHQFTPHQPGMRQPGPLPAANPN